MAVQEAHTNEYPQMNQLNSIFCCDQNKKCWTSLFVCGSNITLELCLQITAPHLALFPTLPNQFNFLISSTFFLHLKKKKISVTPRCPNHFPHFKSNPPGILTGIKLASKFKMHITWCQFGCSHSQHFLWIHQVFVQHMLLYKNTRNLKFPHLAIFINACCHKPIAVLRALKTSMEHRICYFYPPQANDRKNTQKIACARGRAVKHQRAQTTAELWTHPSMGTLVWTGGHSGEEGNLKRKQKLIDLRQSRFAGVFGKQWKGCRDLQ